ncbi:MAG: aldehyde dehydrogenase, partial [Parvibaculaceae bacterium]
MAAAEDYRTRIPQVSYRNQAFIAGKFTAAASGKTFDCISPIDGKVLTAIAECDKEDVERAVKAARAVFEKGTWAQMAPAQRKRILLKWVALIEKHREELALLETLDVGKPITQAQAVDVASSIRCLQWYAETTDKVYDELAPARPDSISMITREPIGVVGAVVPWNFPLMMASWKLGPALATGNSVILKPAEQSPLTALRVAELAAEAGLPEGVLNVLPGFGETAGQALGRHMDVDMIAFTGSTEVGKYFLRYAGESNMKHVALETGGKSPNIVFGDVADINHAAATAAAGVFYNSGQVCTAATRIIVQEKIKDQFVELVAKHADKWRPKDPLDPKTAMGAVVDETQMERVLGYIDAGRKEGARVAFGGERARRNTGGFYVEPTIFDEVKNSMRIAQEEIFGPVVATITFKDDEEAVKIANDTIYGLQASLWTRDITRAH